jgi:hypothetical protein
MAAEQYVDGGLLAPEVPHGMLYKQLAYNLVLN